MTIKEYMSICRDFAADTADWGNLDPHHYYNATDSGWRETPDGDDGGGIDCSWAFGLPPAEITEQVARQKYLERYREMMTLADDDEWDDEQRAWITEMYEDASEPHDITRVRARDNLTWTLDDAGMLTITGTGAMTNWDWDDPPWYGLRESIKAVVIDDGVTSIGDYAFYNCIALKHVTLPDGVTSIGARAFADCSALKSVTIPDGVTSIGDYAFYNCIALKHVTLPDGVTSIGDGAFYYCKALTSVEIGSGVTSIGYGAFSDCSALTSVTLPDSVTSIGARAFANCSALTSVTLPDSVTSIGARAFANCSALKDVYYGGTKAQKI